MRRVTQRGLSAASWSNTSSHVRDLETNHVRTRDMLDTNGDGAVGRVPVEFALRGN